MDNREEIPVFFTVDDGYTPVLSVALKSLIENASMEYRYRIHVIHENMSQENMDIIGAYAKDNISISFHSMKQSLSDITERSENMLRCDYFTITIYFRLFIPEMFPQYDKGIYIDSDVVVCGDISKLYFENLEGNCIGAIPDRSVVVVPEFAKYVEQAIGVDRYHYINSGVLLMDLKKLREKKLGEHFLNLLNTYHFDSVAPDQDYINAMCYGQTHYIDSCWDIMPNKDAKEKENPMLIHYNLFDKPWCYEGTQYEEYFWDYAKKTEYLDQLRKMRDDYTDEDKRSDKEALGRMLSKADELSGAENTFRKRFEQGKKIRL